MECNTCGDELVFVGFYEGASGFMAEYYCDNCVARKVTRVRTDFFDATTPRAEHR